MGFDGFPWVSMGFDGFSMGFDGFAGGSMGLLEVLMGFDGVLMGFDGFWWVCWGFVARGDVGSLLCFFSPGGSRSNSPSPACSPGFRSDNIPPLPPPPTKQQRSFSTIIPSHGSPLTGRKFHPRERQTLGNINIPDIMLSKTVKFNLDSQPGWDPFEGQQHSVGHFRKENQI